MGMGVREGVTVGSGIVTMMGVSTVGGCGVGEAGWFVGEGTGVGDAVSTNGVCDGVALEGVWTGARAV